MNWAQLLSKARLCGGSVCAASESGTREARGSFERDYDRIVYSAPFRRLQNKTQVHTLPNNDHVRNRLTHSLEASTIARSLGLTIGRWLRDDRHEAVEPEGVAACVQAATLAHDIGNPPFGHAGEEAVRSWFSRQAARRPHDRDPLAELSAAQKQDFFCFDGNAQGFRILTRHPCGYRGGGLQLTCAVLGAFVKYPFACATTRAGKARGLGIFHGDASVYANVARELGIPKRSQGRQEWVRHPLVFLVEAADDAAYLTADVEDGVELGLLSVDEAMEAFRAYFPDDGEVPPNDSDALPRFRSRAISGLIGRAVQAFKASYGPLMRGERDEPLLGRSTLPLRELAASRVFSSADKLRRELSGRDALEGLLGRFVSAAQPLRRAGWDPDALREQDPNSWRLLRLTADPVRGQLKGVLGGEQRPLDDYEMLHLVTDFVAGQTDRYAVSLWKSLQGVE